MIIVRSIFFAKKSLGHLRITCFLTEVIKLYSKLISDTCSQNSTFDLDMLKPFFQLNKKLENLKKNQCLMGSSKYHSGILEISKQNPNYRKNVTYLCAIFSSWTYLEHVSKLMNSKMFTNRDKWFPNFSLWNENNRTETFKDSAASSVQIITYLLFFLFILFIHSLNLA